MIKSISCRIIENSQASWTAVVELKTGREILTQNSDHMGFKMDHRAAAVQFCHFVALDNDFKRPTFYEINETWL